ncbi:cation:proton antiporter [Streptomyces sp. SL13]|uniref:Cation:proton antiporter n=1 Tax=Streptantibioticus silvisoli TaxID=2705255 RepID=A0AA90GXG6_9ACTN|nr:cation:proton antiporter [Streptantibioticus silvisoli]MDI5961600.1 cation:proton antiporter [Streptantibioticus silvisoli]MDI5968181.1 cation:proton antiporter [Streptantibioticus silvisoli]
MAIDMTPLDILLVAVAAAVFLAAAAGGGALARGLRQDAVIGEILAGLLVGPVVLWLAGPGFLHGTVPSHVLLGLKWLGEVGLTLFLVGVAHEMRFDRSGPQRRAVGWLTAGSFVPPLLLGGLYGEWLLHHGPANARGSAPGLAFVLFVAVATSITAVPVLARLLSDRRMSHSPVGRQALAAAIFQDSAGWLVLSIALGVNSGSVAGFVQDMLVLVGGVAVAFALRWLLKVERLAAWGVRNTTVTAVVIAVIAVVVAFTVQQFGLTSIFGGALVGLAVPRGERSPWTRPVEAVSGVGRRMVPLFFVVSGITVFASSTSAVSWPLVLALLLLGVLGKAGGGYLGARLGRADRWDSARSGVLMNTRGLTEFVVLQIGFTNGILTGTFFLAFAIMALVTTASTGPALSLITRLQTRRGPVGLLHPADLPGKP